MNAIPFFCTAVLTAAATLQAETVLQVGPGQLPGLTAARDAIRTERAAGKPGPFRIVIADGVHRITEPLILEPLDSGSPGQPLVIEAAPGAAPLVSGGAVLPLVREDEGGVRVYQLPEGVTPEALWIGETRAVVARHPNRGFYRLDEVREVPVTNDTSSVTMTVPKGALAPLTGRSIAAGDVRVVGLHKWDFTRWPLDAVDPAAGTMTASAAKMKPWNPLKAGSRVWLEHHPAFLDEEGEWAVSGGEVLVKWPAGLDPATPVIAAIAPALVLLKGTPEQPVHDITFRGIRFQHADASAPPHEPRQASTYAPAAILGGHVHRVRFEGCEVSHTGAHGVWLRSGARECAVVDTLLEDLGGGGVYIGPAHSNEPAEGFPAVSNRVENCVVAHGGRHYFSAIGIFLGHASDTTAEHNHIADMFYSGFSVGWVWGYKDSVAKRNRIAHNRVQHIGHGLLCDMGGIYTLGRSEGTIVTGNIFHDIHCHEYGGWGLYTDEGSTGILFENNLVADTSTGGFHQHYGRENIVRNNILANARKWQVQATRAEEHLSFTFEHNLVLWTQGDVLNGRWKEAQTLTRSNLYWKVGGGDIRFAGMTLEEWQKAGHETGSVIADPGLDTVPDGRVEFAPGSPALAIGFKPYDWSTAGTRPGRRPMWGLRDIPARLHPQATGFTFAR